MQIIFNIFETVFFDPIINLLVFIVRVLQAAGVPGALGFSIIILSILVRMLIWPLTGAQIKSAKKMADLKPHLDELKKKHGDDKQAYAQAQMALYKEHGINPAAGCLPTLIQLPVVIALYQSISSLFSATSQGHGLDRINNALYFKDWHLNAPIDPNFFGINLAAKPSEFATAGVILLAVPIITAVLQFMQSKMMFPRPVKEYKSDTPKERQEKESTEEAMQAVQGQMIYLMPVMVGYFAFTFPVGLALYWNVFTILAIWQQYQISGWGGLNDWLVKLKLKSA